MKLGITINRPPRDGQMAFVRSPDLHSIELLQKGDAKPPAEPWTLDAEHRPLVRLSAALACYGVELIRCPSSPEPDAAAAFSVHEEFKEAKMGQGILLWLLGVPIPVIILLWLFFGR